MAQISEITVQQRRKNRVSIFLDDEFWTGLELITAHELGLVVGREINRTEQEQLETRIAETEALRFCLDRISQRSMSEGQLAHKLTERGFPERVVECVLARCHELLLLDDEQFARDRIHERRARGQGRRRALTALQDAVISPALAERLLDEVFDPGAETDEAAAALYRRFPDPLDAPGQRRAFAFLIRRGFSPVAASAVIEAHRLSEAELAERFTIDDGQLLLARRYPQFNPRDPVERRRASNWLARRGFPAETVRQLLAHWPPN